MFSAWVMFAFAVSAHSDDAAREMLKGAALYRSCQAEVRLMDLPSVKTASQADLVEGSFCVGFVHGFTGNPSGQGNTCPNGAPVGDVIRAYVAYMDRNPKLLEQDRRVGLQLSMQELYPCPVTQSPGVRDPSHFDPKTT